MIKFYAFSISPIISNRLNLKCNNNNKMTILNILLQYLFNQRISMCKSPQIQTFSILNLI